MGTAEIIVLTGVIGLAAVWYMYIQLIEEINKLKQRVGKLEVPKNYNAVAQKPSASWEQACKVMTLQQRITDLQDEADLKDIEIDGLKTLIELRDEKVRHLNGDIAKLKWDYTNQVIGCKCHKAEEIHVDREKLAELTSRPFRGEWVNESDKSDIEFTGKCSDPDCSECYAELNATSPKPKKGKPFTGDENTDGRV